MIDDPALKALMEADSEVACLVSKGVAYIHSTKFALELPEKQVKRLKWPGAPIKHTVHWADLFPKCTWAKTSAMRDTSAKGLEIVQLVAMNADETRIMQVPYYEFFQEQLDNPVFKIAICETTPPHRSGIGIFVGEQWVGVISAFLPP